MRIAASWSILLKEGRLDLGKPILISNRHVYQPNGGTYNIKGRHNYSEAPGGSALRNMCSISPNAALLHVRPMQGWGEITQSSSSSPSAPPSSPSPGPTSRSRGYALVAFLDVIKTLPHPLEELNIRTHNEPAPEVWEEVYKLEGLKRVSIWCMEGPPRVLQGWCEKLGPTLESLELGRCAGVPPTILIAVLLHLPHLRELRLKGAPASVITGVLAVLPKLKVLDTEYLPSFGRARPASSSSTPPPRARTSSGDFMGPEKLWPMTCIVHYRQIGS
ncbi:hypothetical protein DFP72DRAFT_621600 [Ephemerocybe angulata]|uniref:Uncharacterized protein n=1 Tax=Ephemerocybe angulata TaxID=980116 RepID=A0A8H6LZH8_9AGAR|nr:hypothetical protein DFP72DRAFT_621600 [Tulosesus angulatus]